MRWDCAIGPEQSWCVSVYDTDVCVCVCVCVMHGDVSVVDSVALSLVARMLRLLARREWAPPHDAPHIALCKRCVLRGCISLKTLCWTHWVSGRAL